MAISNIFLKKKVCLSVCLTFFESADARDLGLMTLFVCDGISFRRRHRLTWLGAFVIVVINLKKDNFFYALTNLLHIYIQSRLHFFFKDVIFCPRRNTIPTRTIIRGGWVLLLLSPLLKMG